MRSFVAVADERSFTRAADRLHVAQPWLSVQIRKLEEQLGFRLFERNRNQAVVPSPEAEAFLPAAREYLVAVERVSGTARSIRDQVSPPLRIGAPDFSAEMPMRSAIVDGFLVQAGTLELEVSNAWTVDLLRRLRDGEIDVAFTVGPHCDPHSEALVLARYHLWLLANADQIEPTTDPQPLSRYAGHQIAIFRRNVNPAFHDTIAPTLEAAGVTVGHLTESGVPAIFRTVQRTGMMSLIGSYTNPASVPPGMCLIPLDEPSLSFNLNLVRRVGERSRSVRALWDFAARMIDG